MCAQGDGPPEEQLVVATPEVRHASLDDASEFLILACDGIWEMLTNDQVVDFVEQGALQGQSPKEICESLCDRCLAPYREHTMDGLDNMSVIAVFLQKEAAELAPGRLQQNASAASVAFSSATAAGALELPGTASVAGQAMGSSFKLPSGRGSRSYDAGPGQPRSLPKRFGVRGSAMPNSCVRARITSSLQHCSLSTIL